MKEGKENKKTNSAKDAMLLNKTKNLDKTKTPKEAKSSTKAKISKTTKVFENDLELARFLLKIEKQAYAASKRLLVEINDKKAHDLVTNCDLFIEKFLLDRLAKNFESVTVVSEEFHSDALARGDFFVIDPIDGTNNFANGIEWFGVQMAFVRGGETVASAIFMPYFGEFMAAKGFGAFKDGNAFLCKKQDFLHSLVCIDDHNPQTFSTIWKAFAPFVLSHRFTGVACLNFAMVAQGKLGILLVPETANPWDVLPGMLLAKEAGCSSAHACGFCVIANCKQNTKKAVELLKSLKNEL